MDFISKIRAALLAATWVLLMVAIPGSSAQRPQPATQHGLDMNLHSPESVGFSAERLKRLHGVMQQTIDKKQIAGMATLLARHGKIVDYQVYGQRDSASGAPMTKDTIFRDYSMTKPVTGAAMMILYEQGKWLPNDPISKFIPEFAHLKVFNGLDADGKMILVDPEHPPTMHELLSHTAGFTYGFFGDSPVDVMYRDQKVVQSANLQEMIDKLAKIPLVYQPGRKWVYSVSMDIEGYIVEKLSGKPLPEFFNTEIFTPLGMKDAGFYVPAEKRSRFAALYDANKQDGLDLDAGSATGYSAQPTMASGGGGMVSTIEDYYRFAQMMADGGELNGKRILAPASVKLMTTNHLSQSLLAGDFGIGSQQMRPGFGYGYNCAVEYDPQEANLPDGKGTFLWDGAAGTWFWIDPTNDIVFIGMIQRMRGGNPNVQYLSRSLVYQALVDPSK